MNQPQRTVSTDSASEHMRKRVCKACDRCRLKKSKCDGSSPCSRCKADNAICVFGERKKSHDKVYPKGYVEMLEQQQGQLVAGLQEMYKQLQAASAWTGSTLAESTNGHPLTHDILASLDLLETKRDGSGEPEIFEEDCQRLQTRLYESGAGPSHRRGSLSSDSEHSQHSHHVRSEARSTPILSTPFLFKETFNFRTPASASATALSPTAMQESAPRSQQQQQPAFAPNNPPSPIKADSPLSHDPQFYQAEWAYPDSKNHTTAAAAVANNNNNNNLMRANLSLQTTELGNGLGDLDMDSLQQWNDASTNFDLSFSPFSPQYTASGLPKMMEPMGMGALDPMDIEFNNFIQVS